jgi:hypothetical protein
MESLAKVLRINNSSVPCIKSVRAFAIVSLVSLDNLGIKVQTVPWIVKGSLDTPTRVLFQARKGRRSFAGTLRALGESAGEVIEQTG